MKTTRCVLAKFNETHGEANNHVLRIFIVSCDPTEYDEFLQSTFDMSMRDWYGPDTYEEEGSFYSRDGSYCVDYKSCKEITVSAYNEIKDMIQVEVYDIDEVRKRLLCN